MVGFNVHASGQVNQRLHIAAILRKNDKSPYFGNGSTNRYEIWQLMQNDWFICTLSVKFLSCSTLHLIPDAFEVLTR